MIVSLINPVTGDKPRRSPTVTFCCGLVKSLFFFLTNRMYKREWIVCLHSRLALQSAGNQMRPGCYCAQFAALNSANASECWRCLVLLFFSCA